MADSEQKARRKLEEAEKKCRGGGGLLGKIFGGSGADDAADLFIQPVSTEGAASSGDGSSSDDDAVECDLCGREFADIVAFESHYDEAHSNQCAACAKMFISSRALEVHSDETHCPFHKLRVEKDPCGSHVRCYHECCEQSFTTVEERDSHCHEKHHITNVEVVIERRKMAKRVQDISRTLDKMTVSSSSTSSRRSKPVPRSVRFGDQERAFEGVRNPRRARAKKSDS
ncbi:unnamed protein product [Heligmosomoides polygyrus]|uniref:C2H2-type domain-containing protein n=1 Tax=Heligmosomoides polygyrus TaxID=6339 RepID=A0A183GR80_HELPZ|nr:unnamed protein product [Heligmosomoides polygyrus]